MPLYFSGRTVETLDGLSIAATDSTGKTVVVKASHEAIQDHGQSKVEEVASERFDRGEIEADGSVLVRAAHCA